MVPELARSSVLDVACQFRFLADNWFAGTEELEFFDAQGTQWSNNTLPSSDVCVQNVLSDDGESVPLSTFETSDGLPADC